MKNFKMSLMLLFIIACISAKSQSIVVTYLAGQDNCNAPPEGGTYSVVGTLNGKNQYSKDATHYIEWDGSKWIFKSYTSISGWTTIYTNPNNTLTPPCTGWVATFGCFIPTFSGGCLPLLSSSITKTNVLCNGGSTGSATVTVSGGVGPYNYSWMPSGGTGSVAISLTAGSYTCTITDASSQTVTSVANITQPTALVTSTAVTNILCNGGSTGSATVTASGGSPGYTYLWSSAQTTSVITGLNAGVRTCTVTDNKGCTSIKSVSITQPSALVTSTAVTNVSCNGGANGSATVTASGGTGSYTYLWSSAQTTSVITGLTPGVRTCTVTDANNCTSVINTTINQPTALATSTSVANVLCNGGSTGSSTITASGGMAGYTYLWSSAQTTSVITGLNAGVRTCTVTDANGCKATNTVTISQPTAITITVTASSSTICSGASSTLTANASGGTGAITYTWVGGPTNNTYVVSPTAPTNYTVNVKDASNCTNSATINVVANSCTAASALNLDGGNDYVSIAYAETGTNITHEFWFKTTQANQGLFSVADANPSPGGWDRDLFLTSGNINAYVWLGGPAETIVTSGTNYADGNWHHVAHVVGTGGQKLYVDGLLKASGSAAASSFNWNTKILLGYSNTSSSNKYFNGSMDEVRIWNVARTQCEINSYKNCEIPSTATGLMANYHFNQGFDAGSNGTVTALTDASGNGRNGSLTNFALTGTTSNWVTPGGVTTGSTTPANLSITVGATVSNSVICNGNSTTLSGTGANTYNWTGGVTNAIAFSPTITVTYTVTGTNTVTGCTNTAVATVSVNNCAPGAALNFDGTNDRVNLGSTITNSLSGGNKVTVEAWVKPTSFSGLGCIVGNYNTGSGALQILLRRSGSSYYEFWVGNGGTWNNTNSMATPTLNVWQHVAATWDGSMASIYVNGVLSGTTIPSISTLGNASGNPVWLGGNNINENFTGDVDEVRIWNRVLCKGEIQNNMNGEISTNATGLLANYHFNQGLATGDNTSINTLTDASGNTNTGTLANMSLNGTTSNWSAPGAVNASATPFVSPTISVNSGTICSGQSFTINPSGTTTYTIQGGNAVVNPSTLATYTVVGSTNGCLSNIATSSVTVNSLPTITVNSGAICAGGSFTMVPSGASTYTYSSGTSVVSPTVNDSYTVTGTDANGCVSAIGAVSSVTVNSLPTINVNSGAICAGSSFTMVPSGASTYTYSSGTSVVSPTANDSYTVTGTDANGCVSATGAVSSVTVNSLPTINVNSGAICAGQSFTMTPSGASTYTYSSGTDVVSPTANDSYTVTGTDANGCMSSTGAVSSVTVNSLPTINVNSGAICAGRSFTMTPSGASTYTYSSGTDVVSPTSNNSYTVTGTDANGCVSSTGAVSSVTVNALPTITVATNNTLLCTGETATLTVSGASTYTWSTNENTVDIAVSPIVQTTYTVDGTDANGCSNTTTITQDVSVCTGLAQLSLNNEFSVYPNPSNGIYNISVSTDTKIIITDVLGKIVYSSQLTSGNHVVNMNEYAKGLYILKAENNHSTKTVNLIKE